MGRVAPNSLGAWAAVLLVNADHVRGWQGFGLVCSLLQPAENAHATPSKSYRAVHAHCAHRHRAPALGRDPQQGAIRAGTCGQGPKPRSIDRLDRARVNQPLAGIITNASTCLRMLAADPPNIDGARETARRTIRDGNRASEVIARLRALFSKKDATAESVEDRKSVV